MKYKHIFFDLDNTLWDFERSSTRTLEVLYAAYELKTIGIDSFEDFHETYVENNIQLWVLYRKSEITKSDLNVKRFHDTLKEFGINDIALAQKMANDYVATSPYSGMLMPNAIELLELLKNEYALHIITNGFDELQHIKLETTGLDKYFDKIMTSESVGHKKPELAFFEYAMRITGAKCEDSLVIGDDYDADIMGAIAANIDYIYYNPNKIKHERIVMHEVNDLMEIYQLINKIR